MHSDRDLPPKKVPFFPGTSEFSDLMQAYLQYLDGYIWGRHAQSSSGSVVFFPAALHT
ncbi:hypothetical protein IQ273_21585 [Nodosilinea sp. LEGE 07298]|uniref:hypothetical protein n=1 Tax=Nodosilinea sp. LEGE 07298 TaxID=2777970 RepID=UPI001881D2A8|nr:hypothetical protein [Nodosilinea sp. LEGE 07298]MBE9112001.1 hypothetical protein [Nodosilinea sp. LEGE 07298]